MRRINQLLETSAALLLATLFAACGSSTSGDSCPNNEDSCRVCDAGETNCRILNKVGGVYKKCGGNDVGCAVEGQLCTNGLNCPRGNICNTTTNDNFDSTKPPSTCVKIVCATDTDCEAGKKCSLEKLCRPPVCQANAECGGGQICSGGACSSAPDPTNVASCVIVTPSGAIRQGATVALNAVARNPNGLVLSGIRFTWASSNANAVAVSESTATGGTAAGEATISAKVTGKDSVSCERPARLSNFPNVGAGSLRVVLVDDQTGAAITGASVIAVIGGAPQTQQSGADGAASFQGASADSVTATKDGYQSVTVLSPGTNDVFLPLPTDAVKTKAGGFRGLIDISKSRKAEVQLGVVGPSIPSNLLDFDLASLLGDSLPTKIEAPDLQVNTTANLPGNLVFGLGAQRRFTVDSGMGGANLRCQGDNPSETEIGCFLARASAGPGVAWAFAGQLGISKLTPLATRLSGAIGGGGTGDLPIGEILSAVLPLFRTLYHGINAGLVTTEFDKVPVMAGTDCTVAANANDDAKCRGDFTKYQKISLTAGQSLSINSAVKIPNLPRQSDGTFADGAVMLAVAVTQGRGLVPLGLSAGLDETDMAKQPDGKINGIDQPFGANSPKLTDGEMALTMAPPHSGIEGSKIALVAAALDPNSLGGDSGTQVSGLVKYVDRVDGSTDMSATSFLGFPTGTLDVAAKKFTPTGTNGLTGATVVRYELQRNGKTWLVYAPGTATEVTFPSVGTLQADFLGAGVGAFIQAVRATGTTYAEVFTFGSGKSVDKAVERGIIDGFVIQECTTAASATCKIQ